MARSIRRLVTGSMAAIPLAMAAQCALAQNSPWSIRTGPAVVLAYPSASLSVAGAPVPGGEIGVKNNTTLALELGYALSDAWMARFAFGIPPTTTLSAKGTLTALVPPLTGTLGKVTYGPAALTMTYSFGAPGSIRPYAGAGINYTAILREKDGDVAGLKVRNAFGSVLQAGVDVPLQNGWNVFFDVRKIFVKLKASGTLPAMGGPPAEATLKLNPVVVHAGIGYRF